MLAGALCLLAPLDLSARWVLAILAFTMVLWISETMPLAITGLLASFLLIIIANRPTTDVFAAYFDPVIVLLLGGFVLGVAMQRHGLDATLAQLLLRRTGTHPRWILLGIMGITAAFSMWISNTASTAIMIPIALGIVAANPRSTENLPRTLVLGVAFAANVGGIGTPIGTTANPIALRFLADAGTSISFLGWMIRAVPLVILMVLTVWCLLLWVFPIGREPLAAPGAAHRLTRPQWGVLGVFLLTVALWLTTDLHGVSSAVVAVVPVVLLAGLRLFGEKDLHDVGWPTLLLIGGGLALGDAVTSVGLDRVFADGVAAVVGERGGLFAFAAIALGAVVMTVFASNTAAAVIMIPIVIGLATTWGIPLEGITMLAAAALSLDFLVPVGTPPNAMAYGTGHVSVAQMARVGSLASIAGVVFAALLAWSYW